MFRRIVFNEAKKLFYFYTWKHEVINTLIIFYVEFYLLFKLHIFKKTMLDEHNLSRYQGIGRTIKETWFDSRLL